jgi:uncharacterized membrane protein YeaQ/YmgE (transglycosylase-associated protein family)
MVGLLIFVLLVLLAGSVLVHAGGLIIAVLAWMLAGMLAGQLVRGRGFGPFGDLVLGVAGGFVGYLVLGLFRLAWIGHIWLIGNVIVGVIGALIVVWLVRTFGDRSFAR